MESFRCLCFVVLKDRAKQLNISLTFKIGDHEYGIFVVTETLICYGCGAHGHTRQCCPDVKSYVAAVESAPSVKGLKDPVDELVTMRRSTPVVLCMDWTLEGAMRERVLGESAKVWYFFDVRLTKTVGEY